VPRNTAVFYDKPATISYEYTQGEDSGEEGEVVKRVSLCASWSVCAEWLTNLDHHSRRSDFQQRMGRWTYYPRQSFSKQPLHLWYVFCSRSLGCSLSLWLALACSCLLALNRSLWVARSESFALAPALATELSLHVAFVYAANQNHIYSCRLLLSLLSPAPLSPAPLSPAAVACSSIVCSSIACCCHLLLSLAAVTCCCRCAQVEWTIFGLMGSLTVILPMMAWVSITTQVSLRAWGEWVWCNDAGVVC
jgi:hypothetical protein